MKNQTNINKKIFLGAALVFFLIIFAVGVFAPAVYHRAEEIVPGIFGWYYEGNWSFMNGSVGIGTTSPNAKLDVEVSSGGAATIGSLGNTATGDYAIAIGYGTNASGYVSTATGYYSKASGNYSTAMGYSAKANESYSTAIGYLTKASGMYSTAMGYVTTASGRHSTAMSDATTASGMYSTAMGYETTASGAASTATGRYTTASGDSSTARGYYSIASGNYSTATGYNSIARGYVSTAMGYETTTSTIGSYSTAMGYRANASGFASTAIGYLTKANGWHSTAMGRETTASGMYSTAMGSDTTANGSISTAMGYKTNASGLLSTAIGRETTARGVVSTAMGYYAKADANYSFAWGGDNCTSNITYCDVDYPGVFAIYGGLCVAEPNSTCLDIADGEIQADGAITANAFDLAERIWSDEELEPGDVVVIDTNAREKVRKSTKAYDIAVAGIVSTKPGNILGFEDKGNTLLSLAGRVPVKVTTQNGPIQPGDLLTTSSTSGHAMKFTLLEFTGTETLSELVDKLNENEQRRNSILGKSLEPLESWKGKIMVLLTLQ